MNKFQEDSICPKCNYHSKPEGVHNLIGDIAGQGRPDIKYVPFQKKIFGDEFDCTCGVTEKKLVEHLHVICQRCGFLWGMECNDAEEKHHFLDKAMFKDIHRLLKGLKWALNKFDTHLPSCYCSDEKYLDNRKLHTELIKTYEKNNE